MHSNVLGVKFSIRWQELYCPWTTASSGSVEGEHLCLLLTTSLLDIASEDLANLRYCSYVPQPCAPLGIVLIDLNRIAQNRPLPLGPVLRQITLTISRSSQKYATGALVPLVFTHLSGVKHTLNVSPPGSLCATNSTIDQRLLHAVRELPPFLDFVVLTHALHVIGKTVADVDECCE